MDYKPGRALKFIKSSKNYSMKLIMIFILFIISCTSNVKKDTSVKENRTQIVIVIQPFEKISPILIDSIYSQIKKINGRTVLLKPIPLPKAAYYIERKRYRADSLLHFLHRMISADSVIIGLTDKDISATKNNITDWGIMGLGYNPGNACVVSTYRLNKSNLYNEFFKVVLHELGHTQGLPHCINTTCFMRDAEGKNTTEQETSFCNACKSFLIHKGWKLN